MIRITKLTGRQFFLWVLLILTVMAEGSASTKLASQVSDEPVLLLTYDVETSFEETVSTLREAIKAHNFRTFPDRYLEQGLTDEFSTNKRQLSIRFCNFKQLYEALKLEPRLGVLLPCAITVIELENGGVQVVATNLQVMAELFNNDELTDLMLQLQESYESILDEVAL